MQFGINYIGRTFELVQPHQAKQRGSISSQIVPRGTKGILRGVNIDSARLLIEFCIEGTPEAWVAESAITLAEAAPALELTEAVVKADPQPDPNAELTIFKDHVIPVKSSNLKTVAFQSGPESVSLAWAKENHDATGTIVVEFKKADGTQGDVWAYDGVLAKAFVDMMEADSIGKHFNANIKGNKAYTGRKITL